MNEERGPVTHCLCRYVRLPFLLVPLTGLSSVVTLSQSERETESPVLWSVRDPLFQTTVSKTTEGSDEKVSVHELKNESRLPSKAGTRPSNPHTDLSQSPVTTCPVTRSCVV